VYKAQVQAFQTPHKKKYNEEPILGKLPVRFWIFAKFLVEFSNEDLIHEILKFSPSQILA